MAKRVRAELVSDTSAGSRARRERAEETCARQTGEVLQAHPWQDSDTLSLASVSQINKMQRTKRLQRPNTLHVV